MIFFPEAGIKNGKAPFLNESIWRRGGGGKAHYIFDFFKKKRPKVVYVRSLWVILKAAVEAACCRNEHSTQKSFVLPGNSFSAMYVQKGEGTHGAPSPRVCSVHCLKLPW